MKRLGGDKGDTFGSFMVGNTLFTLVASGELVLGMVNGYRVVDGNLSDDAVARVVPPLAAIAGRYFRDQWSEGSRIVLDESKWSQDSKYPARIFMEALRDALGQLIGAENVTVVKSGTELSELPKGNKVDLRIGPLVENLKRYSMKCSNVATYLDRVVERAMLLTKRKLVPSMWGATHVQSVLDGTRNGMLFLQEKPEDAHRLAGLVSQASTRLIARITSSSGLRDKEDLKYSAKVLVPSILDSHEELLKQVAYAVGVLAPLASISGTVEKNTGSPASFFLPTNVLQDFMDAYAVLVAFLVDIPGIEVGLLSPLECIAAAGMRADAAP